MCVPFTFKLAFSPCSVSTLEAENTCDLILNSQWLFWESTNTAQAYLCVFIKEITNTLSLHQGICKATLFFSQLGTMVCLLSAQF